MTAVRMDDKPLTLDQVYDVAVRGARLSLGPKAIEALRRSRKLVEEILEEDRVVYGVNTGFGRFADVVISPGDVEALQRNLIESHACGVGEPLSEATVRAVMMLRANALAQGHSGIRPVVVKRLIELLNAGIHPVIPSKGSLGASGDLAPLAHMSRALMGEGDVIVNGNRMPAASALTESGIKPVVLQAKEGLALINGTQVMSASGSLSVQVSASLKRSADAIAALTLEVLRGIPIAFHASVQAVRPHPGQRQSAANLRQLLEGSQLTSRPGEIRVQDPYTLRCIPQVHGAVHEVIERVRTVLEREINAATDNPLVFPDAGTPEERVISAGNFHGEPVALHLDFLAMGLTELANISERRIERLLNPNLSEGLPAFLTTRGGLNSGLMITQYTAASLVAQSKVLASPASVDSIPTSASQEDHVSMGMTAALKAEEVVENASMVLAIELLAACQAVEFRGAGRLSPAGRCLYRGLRSRFPKVERDRELSSEIEELAENLRNGWVQDLLKREVGIVLH